MTNAMLIGYVQQLNNRTELQRIAGALGLSSVGTMDSLRTNILNVLNGLPGNDPANPAAVPNWAQNQAPPANQPVAAQPAAPAAQQPPAQQGAQAQVIQRSWWQRNGSFMLYGLYIIVLGFKFIADIFWMITVPVASNDSAQLVVGEFAGAASVVLTVALLVLFLLMIINWSAEIGRMAVLFLLAVNLGLCVGAITIQANDWFGTTALVVTVVTFIVLQSIIDLVVAVVITCLANTNANRVRAMAAQP